MQGRIITLASSLLALTSVLPAFGAVIVVPTNQPTIQDAVNAAIAGDTIQILAGVYFENVTVPAGKDGLQILGANAKTVTVDAQPTAPTGTGPGFQVDSDNVTIATLTVRHAKGDGVLEGDGIRCVANGCHLSGVIVIGSEDNDTEIIGNDAIVEKSTFIGGGFNPVTLPAGGLKITGDNAQVTKNLVQSQGEGGYSLSGNTMLIEGNTAEFIEDGDGFLVVGNGNTITKNTATNIDDLGFHVEGDDNEVEKNKAESTNDDSFFVFGVNPRVVSNTSKGTDDDGFDIVCVVDCTGLLVQGNTASDGIDDSDGFAIFVDFGTGAGWIVEKNKALDNLNGGFFILGSDGIIRQNKALHNGTENESGFLIVGDNNQILANQAMNNEGDGFFLEGNGNLLSKNKANKNKLDGIHLGSNFFGSGVTSDLNTLDKNSAVKNLADGIRNDGTNTTLTNNKANGNRDDCTSDLAGNFTGGTPATVATDAGNVCGDGSSFSLTQTDGVD